MPRIRVEFWFSERKTAWIVHVMFSGDAAGGLACVFSFHKDEVNQQCQDQ